MKEIPVLYKRKEECCGCTACYAFCPKEAISMVEDEGPFFGLYARDRGNHLFDVLQPLENFFERIVHRCLFFELALQIK